MVLSKKIVAKKCINCRASRTCSCAEGNRKVNPGIKKGVDLAFRQYGETIRKLKDS